MTLSMSSWGNDSMILGQEVVQREWCYRKGRIDRRSKRSNSLDILQSRKLEDLSCRSSQCVTLTGVSTKKSA